MRRILHLMRSSRTLTHTAAWPTCALGAWGAARLTGRCSPDDVIAALAESADRHTVLHEEAGDTTDSGNGVLELLSILRPARGLAVRLPSTGDPQGLPPHPATSKALLASEVLLVDEGDTAGTLALVPELDTFDTDPPYVLCRWSVLRYDTRLDLGHLLTAGPSAGDLEYELRQAVAEATTIIGGLGNRRSVDLADLRKDLAARTARHRVDLPPHSLDARSTRLIDTAAQVEAIVDLAVARGVEVGDTAGQWDSGDSALRRLQSLTRAARAAAVNHTIGELLRD
ncbi:Uncharacterised protein [Gordonia paraffinivorans]|uniref:Serine/threonine protein kinase n=2 Tax=Gordonia paraffinivorans TaxID=175628 RepID=A0ABD7UZB0_9ACTN|nr:Uncharacterised protein [Gordonia paraffinivorans]